MAPNQVLLTLFALAFTGITNADAIYTKNSPVLQVTSKNYDSLIAGSNHTSVCIAASGRFSIANHAFRSLSTLFDLPFAAAPAHTPPGSMHRGADTVKTSNLPMRKLRRTWLVSPK
jgi:hypothetical protein